MLDDEAASDVVAAAMLPAAAMIGSAAKLARRIPFDLKIMWFSSAVRCPVGARRHHDQGGDRCPYCSCREVVVEIKSAHLKTMSGNCVTRDGRDPLLQRVVCSGREVHAEEASPGFVIEEMRETC
ncbi:hypothetical protein [Dactylosporangium aurantiacum]|uniref:hypothetical protein n=1 Tax=Dactylosporangium aurantiacum TaxID=35754 RepID=UPI00138E0AC0|nr:hypothetical protein [Dactylosporangium aurantiacum]MDG6108280.1 hypothetical protein [Dactylosporangium aurantiacum]